MRRLPSVGGRDLFRALLRHGYTHSHTQGSHYILKRPDGKALVAIPVHANRDISPGTLRSIVRQCGLTDDEFIELLRS